MKLTTLESIKLKKTNWLIDGIIPKGKLTMLYGTGGVGKTSLLLSLSHELWRNHKIWYWDTEDNSQDMRQLAYGWELNDNFQIGCPVDKNGEEFMPSPDKLKKFLKDFIEEKGWELILIDPITALGIKKSEDNQEVRRVLQPLQAVAAETGCAIVGLHHIKKGAVDASEAFIGAQAFKDCVKHTLILFQDQDENRYLETKKTNTGCGRLAWKIMTEDVCGIDDDGEEFYRVRSGNRIPMDPVVVDRLFSDRKKDKQEMTNPTSYIMEALKVFGESGFTSGQMRALRPTGYSKFYSEVKKQPFWFIAEELPKKSSQVGRPETKYTLTEQARDWLTKYDAGELGN